MPGSKKYTACNKKRDLKNNINFGGKVCEDCITESFLRYFRERCRKCNRVVLADERFIGIHFKGNDAKKPYVGYG